ncbi:MAG: signal peptidase II [Leptolinea sp.]
MRKIIKDYLVLALIAGAIVVLDQWSKAFVRSSLEIGAIWSPWEWLTPYARIVHWQNTGVAFGLFQGQSMIFAVLAIFVSGVIIYYYPRIPAHDRLLRFALGLQLAGALGNLIDRLTVGHVTDFISVGTFPVFNVADSSITVGVVILLISVWLQERRDKHKEPMPDLEPIQDSSFREE